MFDTNMRRNAFMPLRVRWLLRVTALLPFYALMGTARPTQETGQKRGTIHANPPNALNAKNNVVSARLSGYNQPRKPNPTT